MTSHQFCCFYCGKSPICGKIKVGNTTRYVCFEHVENLK